LFDIVAQLLSPYPSATKTSATSWAASGTRDVHPKRISNPATSAMIKPRDNLETPRIAISQAWASALIFGAFCYQPRFYESRRGCSAGCIHAEEGPGHRPIQAARRNEQNSGLNQRADSCQQQPFDNTPSRVGFST